MMSSLNPVRRCRPSHPADPPHSRHHAAAAARGFTLVELLVVIGIIAVLISILLPTLASARRSANSVKCMSQLREIGAALNFYAADNKGFWPVTKHQATDVFPASNASMRSKVARNDFWYQFLLKYFTKKQWANVSGQRLGDFVGTPLWGCPEIDKAFVDTPTADFNSGYGMSPYASYTESKYVGINSAPPAPAVKGSHWAMISIDQGNIEGRYFKATEHTRPAQRGIVADSRSWFLETKNPPSGVPTAQGPGGIAYDPNTSDQFDRYRHGSRAKKIVSYNMLFCDGHVAAVQSIEDGYRAIRMKFPG